MHYFFDDLTGFAAATILAVLLVVLPGFGIARVAGPCLRGRESLLGLAGEAVRVYCHA